MDILILGNGFDLAHDLETKYSDFLEFCKKKYSINTIGSISNNDSFSNNFWLRHFIINEIPNNKWIDLEYEIYNVIKSISNQLFSHRNLSSVELLFPTCYEFPIDYIKDNFDLRNIVKDLKNINKKSTKLSPKEYTFSEGYYSNYLEVNFETYKGFVNFLFEQLQEFTKMFNNYLIEEIIPNINVKKYSFALQAHKSIRVLNFNYTNTFEKLYALKNINAENVPQYIYIHGKADIGDTNLVLGTHSFYNNLPNEINEKIDVNFNVFKKHNQRHSYNTIESYQELIKEINNPKKIITPIFHIIGHSLDKTDHNILKHILQTKKDATINIYYHDEEALERMINNITEIIGEDEVMTRVRFIYQHDAQRGILIPEQESSLKE